MKTQRKNNLRRAIERETTIRVSTELDTTPVRGNALASGDDAEDRRYEDAILARLKSGDEWAWAYVTVEARWRGLEARDTLGACTYEGIDDFRQPGGYYDDMLSACWDDIERQANAIRRPL